MAKKQKIEFFNKIQAGIVSTNEWIMMPNGDEYRYVWCSDWRIITDKDIPKPNFRSSEKWALLGLCGGKIKIIIPGCRVMGFVASQTSPETKTIYCVC